MAIEIVDFPINSMVIFHSLPEGTQGYPTIGCDDFEMARLFWFQDIKKDAATNMMLHRKHLETVKHNIHAHTHNYI